jgi:methionyl-tRNA formyltransferase
MGGSGPLVLKFVLLVDDDVVPAWQARAVELLLKSGTAEIVLIVRNGAPRHSAVRPSRWRQLRPGGRGLWQMFERFVARRSSAILPTPLPHELDAVPHLTTSRLIQLPRTESFTPEEMEAIQAARPDVIVRFGFGILKGSILTAARHGVWSFHHGDPAAVRGQPPGFWEIALGLPVTGVILQRLSVELDAGAILQRGWFGTIAHSYPRQRDQLYFGAAGWIARTSAAVLAGTLREEPQKDLGPILRKPDNMQFLRFAWKTVRATVAIHLRSLFQHQDWTVGVIERPIAEAVEMLTDKQRHDDREIHWYGGERGAFLADPFPVANKNGIRIYAERLPWRSGRGEIVALDYSAAHGFSPLRSLWQPPYHCSYPYIFNDGEQSWCLPEMSEAGEAHLFPITDDGDVAFASGGQAIFLDGLIDPTVVWHNDRYWMFASDPSDGNTVLNIFHAHQMAGPWVPHVLNPVKTDIRSARPAGRPFVLDGSLIRPAQDCSLRYGGAICLNRIAVLTPDDFHEDVWKVISPRRGRYRHGLHTLSWIEGRTVIDGARLSFQPAEFARALKAKLGLAGQDQ